MSESTGNVDGPNDSTMAPTSVLGLPVDTFAYILVGVGVGGAIVFVVIYCLAKAYCKCCCCKDPYIESPKHRSNSKSVREVWQLDTLKRKRDLEAAGYANDAFDNLEELSALSFHKKENSSEDSVAYTVPHSQSNGTVQHHENKLKQSLSSDHLYKKKKKQNGVAVRLCKSMPSSLPILQVNGQSLSPDFDQSPRSKLGSSLVRIEEEVIVEEEFNMDKSKSKKKSKGNKKSLLTTEQSSDGYSTEEAADPTAIDAKAVTPTGSLLNSVVVVHADNDMFKDGETGEQVLLKAGELPAVVDTTQVSLDVSEAPLVERDTDGCNSHLSKMFPEKSVSADSMPSNSNAEIKAGSAHDDPAYVNDGDDDGDDSEDKGVVFIDNDVSQVSKDCQTDLKNLINETVQPDNNDTGSTSNIYEIKNEVSVQSSSENVDLSEAHIASHSTDFSIISDRNVDVIAENETGEAVIVGGIHSCTTETQGRVEGQSSENILKTEALNQDLDLKHTENVSHQSEMIVDKLGDHISNSHTDHCLKTPTKTSHHLETEGNFINNNSVHYSSGKQSSLVYKSPNGLANGGFKEFILTGNPSHTLVSENGFLKSSDNSEDEKLRSWLHDVYVSRNEDPTHL